MANTVKHEEAQMSLVGRARAGDKEAIETMFRQFIPPDEPIDSVAFLGLRGLLGIGVHSFGAVTSRRAAGLEVSVLGGVVYRDGYYEHLNSAAVFQPSRLLQMTVSCVIGALWVVALAAVLLGDSSAVGKSFGALAIVGLFIVTIPLGTKLFYHFVKSGLVLVVREGVSVVVWADRTRLPIANQLSQRASQLREARLRAMRGNPMAVTPSPVMVGSAANSTTGERPSTPTAHAASTPAS
jgi:hypothetical protein